MWRPGLAEKARVFLADSDIATPGTQEALYAVNISSCAGIVLILNVCTVIFVKCTRDQALITVASHEVIDRVPFN